jgi:dienelactone hydrolase
MRDVRRITTAIIALLCCFGAATVAAEPIPTGSGRQTIDLNGTRLTVFTYRPASCSDPPLLLVFHGNARNARSYRDDVRALADRDCLLVVAPRFDQRAFPVWRYQRGGIVKDGMAQNPRDFTGRLVPAIVDWVRQQEGRPLGYSLLGHSAGAQFLDRLAAFVPTGAKRIVVANPGSYVVPSLTVPAPYGLGMVYAGADGDAALRRYLEQPLTIYLGESDTRGDDRDNSPDALAQGASRYQRGLNTFNAAKMLAQSRGWTLNWRLVELPGVGHSARKMFSAPQASDALAP